MWLTTVEPSERLGKSVSDYGVYRDVSLAATPRFYVQGNERRKQLCGQASVEQDPKNSLS